MSDLPGRHRELLVFRELQGLSYQEMADVMGIPMGTVMSGLSRARQAFRDAAGNRSTHRQLVLAAGGVPALTNSTNGPTPP